MTKGELEDFLETIPRDAEMFVKVPPGDKLCEVKYWMVWIQPGSVYERKLRQIKARKAARARWNARKK